MNLKTLHILFFSYISCFASFALYAESSETQEKQIEAIEALGWSEEFNELNKDLVQFENKFPSFKSLFKGIALQVLSEEMRSDKHLENEIKESSFDISGLSNLFLLGGMYFSESLKQAFRRVHNGNASSSEYLVVGLLALKGITVAYRNTIELPSKVSESVWGKQIQFKSKISSSEISHSSAYVTCKLVKNQKSYVLNKEISPILISGSWGFDEDGIVGFATQEDQFSLLNFCAQHLRNELGIDKLGPNDLVPMVSSAYHPKLENIASVYPISFYSNYTDSKEFLSSLASFFN